MSDRPTRSKRRNGPSGRIGDARNRDFVENSGLANADRSGGGPDLSEIEARITGYYLCNLPGEDVSAEIPDSYRGGVAVRYFGGRTIIEA